MNRRERRAVMQRYRHRPDLFAEEILGVVLWSKQREALLSVRDNPRTAVRSCHGVGKTFLAAVVILWFLYCHPNSRVITTAPIFEQVKNLLWREIRARHAGCIIRGTPLGGTANTTDLQLAEEWFAVGLSTNDPIRFQGHHAENLLFVADEASGVPQDIYDAAEGFLTTHGARALLIGNPNLTSGQFYDCFTKEAELWNCIAISVFDSPNFTDEGKTLPAHVLRKLVQRLYEETARKKWGVDSPLYQVRVLGQFPTGATNTVISLAQVDAAVAQVYEPKRHTSHDVGDTVCLSCDVARYGDDETVIGIRVGKRYRELDAFHKKSTTHTSGRLLELADAWDEANPDLPISYIVVDDSGVGGGVVDNLKDDGEYHVFPFNGGMKPRNKKRYTNARSEAWFVLAEQIHDIDMDRVPELTADLVAPTYKLDGKGHRVVEEKSDTKKRLKRSPDHADTMLMAFYPATARKARTLDEQILD